MNRRRVSTVLVLVSMVMGTVTVWCSLNHEPDTETIEFSDDPKESNIISSSKTYCFVYTDERADTVTWYFGDGTEVQAFSVVKKYDSEGDYYVLCKASNLNGDSYSAYQITIEEKDFEFFAGYTTELFLALSTVILMAASIVLRRHH